MSNTLILSLLSLHIHHAHTIHSPIRAGNYSELVHAIDNQVFLVPLSDSIISHHIKTFGHYEKPARDTVMQFIAPGSVIVDVGANIGSWTVPMAIYMGKQGRVYAFEVQPETFLYLNSNLALNGLSNVFPIEMGVGNEVGSARIYSVVLFHEPNTTRNAGGFSFFFPPPKSNWPLYDVSTITLDAMMQRNMPCPDFIKMDVEMYELYVLQGSVQVLETCQPVLYLELGCRHFVKSIVTMLNYYGYSMAYIAPLPSDADASHLEFVLEDIPINLLLKANTHPNLLAMPSYRAHELYHEDGSRLQNIYPLDYESGKLLAEEYNIQYCSMDRKVCELYTQTGEVSDDNVYTCVDGQVEIPLQDVEYWKTFITTQ
eukprot:CAMPEP_0185020536 /NCGR_PEP_ID=MMETSP1103-20130426/3140_1 /TAXON_ID=36769 /ORGANISM="Paraphysomonas bandaiensis, Strain Caron Lab Isolate" /LENGTH=370 /DNA_ID=CAMNT_0027551487 /DNA_START=54 /DNA_END=1166 /DNA_ORIENTATION=-